MREREQTHIRDHNPRKRTQKHRIPTHERQEPLRAREDLPGAQRPPRKERADNLASTNIDVAREEDGHVVRGRERVRGDVAAEGGEHECEGREERRGAVVPLVDERERVPEHLPVQHQPGGGHHHACEAREREGNGDDEECRPL